jgi:hypothetical protein
MLGSFLHYVKTLRIAMNILRINAVGQLEVAGDSFHGSPGFGACHSLRISKTGARSAE